MSRVDLDAPEHELCSISLEHSKEREQSAWRSYQRTLERAEKAEARAKSLEVQCADWESAARFNGNRVAELAQEGRDMTSDRNHYRDELAKASKRIEELETAMRNVLTWSTYDDEEDDEPDEDDMIDALVEIHEVARKSLPSMASVCIDQTSGTAASRPAEAVKEAAPGCIGAPLADRDPVSAPFGVPSDPRNERFERAKEEWLKVTGEDVSHLQCPSEARRAIPCTCSNPALHEIDCPYVQACAPYGRCSKCNKPLTLPPSMPGIGPSTCGDCWRASQRTNDARMRCEHEWQHRCGKCGEPSELDGCTETERSSAIAAFRKIASLTEHDSPIDQVVQEAVAVLLHEQDQCTDKPSPDDVSHRFLLSLHCYDREKRGTVQHDEDAARLDALLTAVREQADANPRAETAGNEQLVDVANDIKIELARHRRDHDGGSYDRGWEACAEMVIRILDAEMTSVTGSEGT